MWRYLKIVLVCFQNITLGGLIYGWSSISGSLLQSHENGVVYSVDLLNFAFVIASLSGSLGILLLGFVTGKYGPRICSVLGISCILLGFFLLSFADKQNFTLFVFALSFIAFGGSGNQNAMVHFSNLFPTNKPMIIALICGAYRLSFLVFYLFDILSSQYGWSLKSLCYFYLSICFFNLIITLHDWPDKSYRLEDRWDLDHTSRHLRYLTKNQIKPGTIRLPSVWISRLPSQSPRTSISYIKSNQNNSIKSTGSQTPPTTASNSSQHNHIKDRDGQRAFASPKFSSPKRHAIPPSQLPANLNFHIEDYMNNDFHYFDHHTILYEKIRSKTFLGLLFFASIAIFWLNFYIGTLDSRLRDSHHEIPKTLRTTYCHYFTIILALGAIVVPLSGMTMDMECLGMRGTALLILYSYCLWSLILCIDISSFSLLLLSYFLCAILHVFTYTFAYAFLAESLGSTYFGVLSGTLFTLCGIIGLLQHPLLLWINTSCSSISIPVSEVIQCYQDSWRMINIVQLLSFITLLLFYYYNMEIFGRHQRRSSSTSRRPSISYHGLFPLRRGTSVLAGDPTLDNTTTSSQSGVKKSILSISLSRDKWKNITLSSSSPSEKLTLKVYGSIEDKLEPQTQKRTSYDFSALC